MRTAGINERLYWARERTQLTVRALADAARVSTTTIVDTEHGRRVPGADTLERLAVALHVEPCWLAYGDGKAPDGWSKSGNS
jgi:transcriptional regulator with XRE-family HTH domain